MLFWDRMTVISAWLSVILLIMVVGKFLTKRIGVRKLDKLMMKYHKLFTKILIITSIIHGVCSFSHFTMRSIPAYVLGVMSLAGIIIARFSMEIHRGKKEKWLRHHRIFATASLIALIVHIVVHIRR